MSAPASKREREPLAPLNTPANLGEPSSAAAKKAAKIKRKATTKSTNSAAVSIEQLLELDTPDLEDILSKGEAQKEKQGVLRRSDSGCIFTVHAKDSEPDAKSFHRKGEPNPYPQYNSNTKTVGGSNKFKLYQVAAVLAIKRKYPDLSPEQLLAWTDRIGKAEASHLCRRLVTIEGEAPDGNPITAVTTAECKACFCEDHLWIEPDNINRSRIKCVGGESCRHTPKCILVE